EGDLAGVAALDVDEGDVAAQAAELGVGLARVDDLDGDGLVLAEAQEVEAVEGALEVVEVAEDDGEPGLGALGGEPAAGGAHVRRAAARGGAQEVEDAEDPALAAHGGQGGVELAAHAG